MRKYTFPFLILSVLIWLSSLQARFSFRQATIFIVYGGGFCRCAAAPKPAAAAALGKECSPYYSEPVDKPAD
jgi:hypothetical protein